MIQTVSARTIVMLQEKIKDKKNIDQVKKLTVTSKAKLVRFIEREDFEKR